MIVRGIAAALGLSAAAIIGASLAPAWADAEAVKPAAVFGSNGALDASSLGGIRTGLAPAPGRDDEEELRRKRPDSSDADPLRASRGGDQLPRESGLSNPFTATRTINRSPINQQPAQNPPAATNPPPATSNPPLASNPPPAQNTIPIANNSPLSSVTSSTSGIGAGVITILRRDGLLQ